MEKNKEYYYFLENIFETIIFSKNSLYLGDILKII